jgi:SAM-dependent MidA family methyltransferase
LARTFVEQDIVLEDGQEAEVCLAFADVMEDVERLLARGFVLSVDYGAPSAELFHPDRTRGTIRTFHDHAVGGDPFAEPGRRDITAHVDFGRLAAVGERAGLTPLIFATQGTYLLNSAEALLRRIVEDEAKSDPGLPRRVQQLLHPEGMGGAFHVLVQGKNVGTPALSGGKINRIHRLATNL